MNSNLYYLLLNMVEGLSPAKLEVLVEAFGNPKQVWMATEKDLQAVPGITPKVVDSLLKNRHLDPETEMKKFEDKGVTVIFANEPAYPEMLKNIYDPPRVLFCMGDVRLLQSRMIGIVGSRKATSYGMNVAETIAGDLAEAGVCVVSGMARGIDTAAHKGALGASGQTVAVLGCGIDVVYPKENRKLMSEIIDKGVVISEFPPGMPPLAMNFPRRNRIISGLSEGIMVVEAAPKSGSLITADFAMEQGRDVFAVPGQVTNPLNRGAHNLIKQGAKLVEGASDILEELGIKPAVSGNRKKDSAKDLTNTEKTIYNIVSDVPVNTEEIIDRTGIDAGEILAALLTMELEGLVSQLPGQLYVRRGKL